MPLGVALKTLGAMSVLHSTGFCPPSIRRMSARPSLKSQQQIKEKIELKLPTNLKAVVLNFIQRIDISSYEDLVYIIKEQELDDGDLQRLLADTREIISLMDRELHHFVEVLLRIPWYKRGAAVTKEYQGFLIDLLSAHNYYMDPALENIVGGFKSVDSEAEWDNCIPTHKEEQSFQNLHDVLQMLLKIVPMSCNILLKIVSNNFPYLKRSAHIHEAYVYNMLKLIKYRPELRLHFLQIIFLRLINLDVNAPKREIEKYEEEERNMDMCNTETVIFKMDESDEIKPLSVPKLSHPIANTLDVILEQLFKYLRAECHDVHNPSTYDALPSRSLYQDLRNVFDNLVLPTHDIHHVQFVMFYMCSFNVSIAEAFLNFLWSKVSAPCEAPIVRQTAVLYISSLLARATYIPIIILKDVISKVAVWIHNYISNQDGLENANSDVRLHLVFYSICQALFYVIAFRHPDLVNTRKNLTFLQSLNFTKIVSSRLNPLRVCIPSVVQNFAAVTRTYQLAYCYTIIEHNSRNTIPVVHQDEQGRTTLMTNNCLETFFPFDPFMLARSGRVISPIYREYQKHSMAVGSEMLLATVKKEEDDDFLGEQLSTSSNAVISMDVSTDIFSYGSSPGFKHIK